MGVEEGVPCAYNAHSHGKGWALSSRANLLCSFELGGQGTRSAAAIGASVLANMQAGWGMVGGAAPA